MSSARGANPGKRSVISYLRVAVRLTGGIGRSNASTISMGAVLLWRAICVSWTPRVLCCADVLLSVGFPLQANTTDPRLVNA